MPSKLPRSGKPPEQLRRRNRPEEWTRCLGRGRYTLEKAGPGRLIDALVASFLAYEAATQISEKVPLVPGSRSSIGRGGSEKSDATRVTRRSTRVLAK